MLFERYSVFMITDNLTTRRFLFFVLRSPCCIVAAVGDGMSHTTGVAGRFFKAMGSASINVLAIAQVHSKKQHVFLV